MRIVVVGTSGSGKTTMAKALAAALALPFVELDAVQWQPNWQPLLETDREEFIRLVAAATVGDAWVVDGNYGAVRHLTWGRATHLVWLDYERPVIMWRVIRRSLWRAVRRTELWAGNRERWRHLWRPDHPIRWAWNNAHRHHVEYAQRLMQPESSHLVVLRLRHPREAEAVVRQLKDAAQPLSTAPPCP